MSIVRRYGPLDTQFALVTEGAPAKIPGPTCQGEQRQVRRRSGCPKGGFKY
jgi:hypothetical protein